MSNLMERSYRIGRDGTTVVCDAIAVRGEIDAFRDALAWRRDQLARLEHHAADDVLALRAWMTLDDMLAATTDFREEVPLTVTREQAQMLCELAACVRHRARRRELPARRGARADRDPALAERPADGLLLRVRRGAG